MATDGVWDNLFNEDIQVCVNSQLQKDGSLKSAQKASDCISTLAEAKSYDPTYKSPWYLESLNHEKKYHEKPGGKEDDITVIVSQINVE